MLFSGKVFVGIASGAVYTRGSKKCEYCTVHAACSGRSFIPTPAMRAALRPRMTRPGCRRPWKKFLSAQNFSVRAKCKITESALAGGNCCWRKRKLESDSPEAYSITKKECPLSDPKPSERIRPG